MSQAANITWCTRAGSSGAGKVAAGGQQSADSLAGGQVRTGTISTGSRCTKDLQAISDRRNVTWAIGLQPSEYRILSISCCWYMHEAG